MVDRHFSCARALRLALLAAGLFTVGARADPAEDDARATAAVAAYAQGALPAAAVAFRDLAAKGHPLACFNLAMMHLRQELPDASPEQAHSLLRTAAQSGFVRAEHALGEMHEQGLAGPRDLVEANRWYARAAEHGHVDAQVALATGYFLGRGIERSDERAAHWYREAAKQGDVGAQYIIASMYERGDGVVRDWRLARYWYQAAADNGDEAAPAKVRQLDQQEAAGR